MEVLILFLFGVFVSATFSARRDQPGRPSAGLLVTCVVVAVALASHRLA